ncbi:membrane-bound lysozyme inhibitor of c-type lysozyme MliC [Panacagrimonas perspica]|uniref:Membrane-bound lysozyme inhibitor of c-type lysozyme MliC n=1 Tax=Panacagrimonas perspica TaxID=381431 RepID=A0A4R7PF35_9GAMM|nr:MliC family protein [Panacagrimonas perspica]TDU32824.1 membrane-bound lysozyme inhibitor of c-type lysozyme MliC [Panacagrimonas perspica]
MSAVRPLHHAALLASLFAVGLVACSKKEESTAATDSAAASTSAPAAAAPAASGGGSADAPANTKYLCSSNIVLAVSYKPGVAKFTYKDKPLEFKAEAAEPTRYITAGYEWWVNGRGQGANGNLYTQAADGTTGEFIEGCIENPNK